MCSSLADQLSAGCNFKSLEEGQKARLLFSGRVSFLLEAVCRNNDLHTSYEKESPFTEKDGQTFERLLGKAVAAELATQSVVIVALVLLDRVQSAGAPVNTLTVKRLFAICIILASKFVKDDHMWNKDFLFMFEGLDMESVNELENKVLILLDFGVYVSGELYKRYELAITKPLH